MAKDADVTETLALCRLTIALSVMSGRNQEIISGIQSLAEEYQHMLMEAITLTMSKLEAQDGDDAETSQMTDDDHYYEMHLERSRVLSDKDTLEKAYQTLLEEHQKHQRDLVSSQSRLGLELITYFQ